jgi:hypothetical protein
MSAINTRSRRKREKKKQTHPNSLTFPLKLIKLGAIIVTHAPELAPNNTQKAIAPPVLVAPNMAKIITPMRAVMGRATVRFPRRSATRPMERRETAAEALRMESWRRRIQWEGQKKKGKGREYDKEVERTP